MRMHHHQKQQDQLQHAAHRRKPRAFRSRELLAELTQSVEAITIGDRNCAARPRSHTHVHADVNDAGAGQSTRVTTMHNNGTHSVDALPSSAAPHRAASPLLSSLSSPLELQSHSQPTAARSDSQQLQHTRKQRLARRDSMRMTLPASTNGNSNIHNTADVTVSVTSVTSSTTRRVSDRQQQTQTQSRAQRHPIGTFETIDVTWTAGVAGELETFMYPSLRLEPLFAKCCDGSGAFGTNCIGTKHIGTKNSRTQIISTRSTDCTAPQHYAGQQQHRHEQHSSSSANSSCSATHSHTAVTPAPNTTHLLSSMPTLAAVVAVSSTTKVDWTLVKRYQNPTESAPLIAHTRLSDAERTRLQFDTRLEMAECLLRKRELLLENEELCTTSSGIESSVRVTPFSRDRRGCDHNSHEVHRQARNQQRWQDGDDTSTRRAVGDITTTPGSSVDRGSANSASLVDSIADPDSNGVITNDISNDSSNNDTSDVDDNERQSPACVLSPRSLYVDDSLDVVDSAAAVRSVTRDAMTIVAESTSMCSTDARSLPHVAATLVQIVREATATCIDNMDDDDNHGESRTLNSSKPSSVVLHLQHYGLGDAKTLALAQSLELQFQSIQVLDLTANRLTDASIVPLLQRLTTASSSVQEQQPCGKLDRATGSVNYPSDTKTASSIDTIGIAGIKCIKRTTQTRGTRDSISSRHADVVTTTDITMRNDTVETRDLHQHCSCNTALHTLNLSHNAVGVRGCAQLAQLLGVCAQLTQLNLAHTGISDDALALLAAALATHAAAWTINLSSNRIGDRGGTMLGAMLAQSTCSVTALDVSWNDIGCMGATALGAALCCNTSLQSLALAMNRCGDDGSEQLAAALSDNASLLHLDLSHNALSGRAAVTFAFFVRSNTTLQSLVLLDNALSAVGARALLRAVAAGVWCDIALSIHDIAAAHDPNARVDVFDSALPWLSSPFELHVGASPYDFAVASLLFEAALTHERCLLSDLVFVDCDDSDNSRTCYGSSTSTSCSASNSNRSVRHANASTSRATTTAQHRLTNKTRQQRVALAVDMDTRTVVELTTRTQWTLPRRGILRAHAQFVPAPLPQSDTLDGTLSISDASWQALLNLLQRALSARETLLLLDLMLSDVFVSVDRASWLVAGLQDVASAVDVVARLWACLTDSDRTFAWLQAQLTPREQRRAIDAAGASTLQFTPSNPTGHWMLDLRDWRHRKLMLWFASLNAYEAAFVAMQHAMRSDSSQYGSHSCWRNARLDRRAVVIAPTFFQSLPRTGVLEFDFVSLLRHEDAEPAAAAKHELCDDELHALLHAIGAEVCAVYTPLPKRADLTYQLVLLHAALAGRFVTCAQAHVVLQHFPKTHERARLTALLALHRSLIDLEHVGTLLERLPSADRPRAFATLGYFALVNPLALDGVVFDVDFVHDDERTLLRALVDQSMASPLDVIRIDSARSTVHVIYSMYQTNSVPTTGHIVFRYVSHTTGVNAGVNDSGGGYNCGDTLNSSGTRDDGDPSVRINSGSNNVISNNTGFNNVVGTTENHADVNIDANTPSCGISTESDFTNDTSTDSGTSAGIGIDSGVSHVSGTDSGTSVGDRSTDWLHTRQSLYRHFLCGERLQRLSENAQLALAATANTKKKRASLSQPLPRSSSSG